MGFLGTPLGFIMYAIESFIHNYGLTLILFVLLTKAVLYPLAVKQQKTTAKTASIQPKLQALQKKCGKDKQKYQQEMMKLYEEEGVNPAGGCLPMLVQFALLFGIIDVIYKPLKHLLRIPADKVKEAIDIAVKALGAQGNSEIALIHQVQTSPELYTSALGGEFIEKIQNFDMTFLGIDLGIVPKLEWSWLLLLPLVSGGSAFIMSMISMRQQAKNGQVMQGPMKYMMYLSPLMSVWFAFSLPAGVAVYWIVSNLFQIGQQLLLGKLYSPAKLAVMTDKNTEKNREKMRIKREKMEAYNQQLIAQGKAPLKQVADSSKTAAPKEKIDSESVVRDKDEAKARLAEARRRMAEKYGDEYKD